MSMYNFTGRELRPQRGSRKEAYVLAADLLLLLGGAGRKMQSGFRTLLCRIWYWLVRGKRNKRLLSAQSLRLLVCFLVMVQLASLPVFALAQKQL